VRQDTGIYEATTKTISARDWLSIVVYDALVRVFTQLPVRQFLD